MVYVCEWATGQCVYLENVDRQTRVTMTSSSVGQQQQASSSFQTGRWIAPPEVLRSAIGVVVKLFTAQGDRFVQIQGNSISTLSEAPSLDEAQSLHLQQVTAMPTSTMAASTMTASTMPPMRPMPPMKMGAMQMDQTAMTMQMGGMRLEMPIARSLDPSPQPNAAEPSESAVVQRNFCSQCGSGIKPSDRFCASCGHHLA